MELPELPREYRSGPSTARKFLTGIDESADKYIDTHAWGRKSTRKDNHALQNLNQSKDNLLNQDPRYKLNIPIPKEIFNEDYPVDPKTFGERLRKARIDAGLLIKEFAALIGVTEDTVINWELREMRPWRKTVRERVNQFIE